MSLIINQPKPVDVTDVIDLESCVKMLVAGIFKKNMRYGNTQRSLRELNAVIQFAQEAKSSDGLLDMLRQPAAPPATNPDLVSLLSKIDARLDALEAKMK